MSVFWWWPFWVVTGWVVGIGFMIVASSQLRRSGEARAAVKPARRPFFGAGVDGVVTVIVVLLAVAWGQRTHLCQVDGLAAAVWSWVWAWVASMVACVGVGGVLWWKKHPRWWRWLVQAPVLLALFGGLWLVPLSGCGYKAEERAPSVGSQESVRSRPGLVAGRAMALVGLTLDAVVSGDLWRPSSAARRDLDATVAQVGSDISGVGAAAALMSAGLVTFFAFLAFDVWGKQNRWVLVQGRVLAFLMTTSVLPGCLGIVALWLSVVLSADMLLLAWCSGLGLGAALCVALLLRPPGLGRKAGADATLA